MFDWILDTPLELLKWSYYIYACRKDQIHINSKETVFKERSKFFEKLECFREFKSYSN